MYGVTLLGLSLYSYALIDPNITLFNHPLWSRFLETMLPLGYYQRQLSWQIYLLLISLLFFFNVFFIRIYKEINPLKLAFFISLFLLFSYNFLSHDFLKYMFDAKILTVYHKIPYFYRPIDFSFDPWLRFLHWIEQPYRYGPIFLLIIIIPSFLAGGKFFLSFIFFKFFFAVFYLLGVFYLNKLNKKWAVIFATNPLILVDGLINSHNDIIGVSLLIMGIYWILNNSEKGRLLLIISVGIKYLTLPVVFISKNKKSILTKLIFFSFILLPFLLLNSFMGTLFNAEIQTWYFIILLGFLPFYENIITKLNILFFGLLLSYYPFIRLGVWEQFYNISIKHIIIVVFASVNLTFFLLNPKWRKALFGNNF